MVFFQVDEQFKSKRGDAKRSIISQSEEVVRHLANQEGIPTTNQIGSSEGTA